jgi:hypothetical protein
MSQAGGRSNHPHADIRHLKAAFRILPTDGISKLVAGDSPLKSLIFSLYVNGPCVAAAYREASSAKR